MFPTHGANTITCFRYVFDILDNVNTICMYSWDPSDISHCMYLTCNCNMSVASIWHIYCPKTYCPKTSDLMTCWWWRCTFESRACVFKWHVLWSTIDMFLWSWIDRTSGNPSHIKSHLGLWFHTSTLCQRVTPCLKNTPCWKTTPSLCARTLHLGNILKIDTTNIQA